MSINNLASAIAMEQQSKNMQNHMQKYSNPEEMMLYGEVREQLEFSKNFTQFLASISEYLMKHESMNLTLDDLVESMVERYNINYELVGEYLSALDEEYLSDKKFIHVIEGKRTIPARYLRGFMMDSETSVSFYYRPQTNATTTPTITIKTHKPLNEINAETNTRDFIMGSIDFDASGTIITRDFVKYTALYSIQDGYLVKQDRTSYPTPATKEEIEAQVPEQVLSNISSIYVRAFEISDITPAKHKI